MDNIIIVPTLTIRQEHKHTHIYWLHMLGNKEEHGKCNFRLFWTTLSLSKNMQLEPYADVDMHKNILTADKVVYKCIVPMRLRLWETWPSSNESSSNEASLVATCAMAMTATDYMSKHRSNTIQSIEISDLLVCVNKRNDSHPLTKSAYFTHAFPVSSDASERSSSTAVFMIPQWPPVSNPAQLRITQPSCR